MYDSRNSKCFHFYSSGGNIDIDLIVFELCIVFDTKVLKNELYYNLVRQFSSHREEYRLYEKGKKHPVPPAESHSPASAITVSGFSSEAVALT